MATRRVGVAGSFISLVGISSLIRHSTFVIRPWAGVVAAIMVGLSTFGGMASRDAAAEVIESFEGPDPTWSLVDADCPARVATQVRQFRDAYRDQGCEYLKVVTGQGSYAYLSHALQPAPVIDELAVSVWVKSDRPGVQLRLRVVLPRTTDDRTGKPMTTFLVGGTYQSVGTWQRLAVDRPMVLLQRQQAVLRLQFGQRVDVRQAYVDRVVLNAHGGGQQTQLWIDELEVTAAVSTGATREVLPLGDRPPAPPAMGEPLAAAESAPAKARRAPPTLKGGQLLLGTRPFLPRAVRYQGQPLVALKELGFNTVVLDGPVSPQLAGEAAQYDLWLVAPPPTAASGVTGMAADSAHPLEEVLAWNVSLGPAAAGGPMARVSSRGGRPGELPAQRPALCVSGSQWSDVSRWVDLLVVDVAASDSGKADSIPLRGHWESAVRQMRPGTAWWATIPVAPIAPMPLTAGLTDSEEDESASAAIGTRRAVFTAIGAGARGLMFDLPAGDPRHPDWRDTASVIRAINAELQLLEPWIAGGHGVERLASPDPRAEVWALRTDRARLVVALVDTPAAVSGGVRTRRARPLTFIDGGAANAAEAYLIDGADFRPQRRRRVAGGIVVTVDDVSPVTLVVLTHEPVVVHYLARALTDRRTSFAR